MIPATEHVYLSAARPRSDAEPGPVAVSVLVASRDPAAVASLAPRVARMLWPGHVYGRVLHVEDADRPDAPAADRYEWSTAAVEVIR